MQAFSRILVQHPDIRLKIAGDGKEKEHLMRLGNDLGIAGNLDFLGVVRGHEKAQLLSGALFLVLPSQREGLPVVVLEAFASGIPVVASSVGGTSDIIKDDENGFLVPYGDIEGFAGKILLLLGNDLLRGKLAVNALAACPTFIFLCSFSALY